MAERKKLLDVRDIATMLSISEREVYRLVERQELPKPKKVGGRAARWFRRDVLRYLRKLEFQEEK